jgi:hypothetical protein
MGEEAGVQAYRPTQTKEVKSMDPDATTGNGTVSVRLTADQVHKLAKAVNIAKAEEIDVSNGADGRLLVKQVVKVERMKALKLY